LGRGRHSGGAEARAAGIPHGAHADAERRLRLGDGRAGQRRQKENRSHFHGTGKILLGRTVAVTGVDRARSQRRAVYATAMLESPASPGWRDRLAPRPAARWWAAWLASPADCPTRPLGRGRASHAAPSPAPPSTSPYQTLEPPGSSSISPSGTRDHWLEWASAPPVTSARRAAPPFPGFASTYVPPVQLLARRPGSARGGGLTISRP
jgi:hypothetical protein